MGPIEIIYGSIAVIVVMIGLARGYVKELGNTLVLLSAIFLLSLGQSRIAGVLGGRVGADDVNLLLSAFFSILFIAITFASYSGRTVTFSGRPAPPPGGTLLSLLIGLLNGYLIAGSLWYYQDIWEYPIQRLVPAFDPNLTETADTMVKYLPQTLFDSPVYWAIPVILLLLLRVRG